MAIRNDESNPFVEVALQSLGSVIVPAAFWGAAYLLYMDSHHRGYYNPEIETWVLGLIAAGAFPGIPVGLVLGITIAEIRGS